jgi:ribonuclease Z
MIMVVYNSYFLKNKIDGFFETTLKLSKNDMKIIFLGTGNTLGGVYRSKPSAVLIAAGEIFLIDCGSGAVQRMLAKQIYPNNINKIFFTHFHADHSGGFIDFFITSSLNRNNSGRKVPVEVFGPDNSKEVIFKMRQSIESDVTSRHSVDDSWSKIIVKELNDGEIYNKNGLVVKVFTVNHGPYKPSVGYKFEYNKKKIVFSGDTSPNENVLSSSENADILVHESYNKNWVLASIDQNPENEGTMKSVMLKHTSTIEASKIAREAGVKHLVLTHHIPSPLPLKRIEQQYISGMSKIFSGKITVARDLMEIEA